MVQLARQQVAKRSFSATVRTHDLTDPTVVAKPIHESSQLLGFDELVGDFARASEASRKRIGKRRVWRHCIHQIGAIQLKVYHGATNQLGVTTGPAHLKCC